MAKKKRGIYADAAGTQKANLEDKVADFSYESDVLAQLIVEMWLGQHTNLLTPKSNYSARSAAAKAMLAARGIYLEQPIVIKEDEYDVGFNLEDAGLSRDDGVVFVLPRDTRPTTAGPPPSLLETAKLLMAVTPNGI
jgi:hypothetical protein